MILSPGRRQVVSIAGAMIHRNNLARCFSRPGDLLTSMGGASTHAYYQYQHIHLHHQPQMTRSRSDPSCSGSGIRQFHSTCSCLLSRDSEPGNSSGRGQRGQSSDFSSTPTTQGNVDPQIQAKLDELKEKLAANEYFEKYKEKFERLELTSPRELLAKLEQLDRRSRPPKPSSTILDKVKSAYSQTKTQTLQEVMEVDLLKDLGREDIIYLWQEFHRKKDGLLAAVMAGSVFERMTELASTHPMFVLPLPRDHGYEFYFVAYTDKAFHFTPLIAYQAHKDNAPECLRLINYADLQSSKDLVLMRGEFDTNLMTTKDAHMMAVQINFYYGETSDSRKQLLETFSSSPDSFQYMDLIEEFKKLQETHQHLFELDDKN